MKTIDFLKCICGIFFCTVPGQSVFATDYGSYCLYLTNQTSTNLLQAGYTFTNLGFLPGAGYCTNGHYDPDGNQYYHGHPYEVYSFYDADHDNNEVTLERINWGFDYGYKKAHDDGYGATWTQNCYGYATDGMPMNSNSWAVNWTTASSQCENTQKKKSFYWGPAYNHVIVITATCLPWPEGTCVIVQTKEKAAAGGVYNFQYTMAEKHSETNAVRKRK
jgi:hypothetical protein